MQLATAMNLRKAMDEETKRERFASWYSTLPGIPAHEKEIIERSLKYNVWKELIKLFVVYMILSLVWFFGAGQYDPFESVTGYSLIEKKSVIGVVQEDGESLRLKNPNKGEHVSYTLAELGMDPIKYSYGSRFQTYWEKEKNGEYQLLAVLPEKQVSKIEGLYYGVMGVGYFAILIGGICAFFIRRKYSVERGYDTVDAIIAYGNENPIYFVNEFSNIHLTKEEVKKKKSKLAMVWLTSIAVMAGIILVISLYVNITSAIECRQNEARTAAVLEKLQNAIDEKTTGLGDKSEYYNYADMIDRARDTFPEEDIYYKLQTTEDYVTIIVTTKKKQNVCFDRYVPVQGSIGDEDTEYKLEIAMVSDAMQPDDILHNYTGILKIK